MALIHHRDRGNGGKLQPEWMATVRIGDVLKAPGGVLRVVREVRRYPNGNLRSLAFTIRRCSWTRRPITGYGFTDLRIQGWEPTGVNVALDSELDGQIRHELTIPMGRERRLSCCDVEGIA